MRLKTTLVALFFMCIVSELFAQQNHWTPISNSAINSNVFTNHYKPGIFTSFKLDETALRAQVANAPLEGTVLISESPVVITVPNASGGFETYKVVESPVMEQGLAIKYPMIKTYLAQSTDKKGSVMRFDLTLKGFNASILSPNRKTIYINTVDEQNNICVVFDRDGMSTVGDFKCNIEDKKSIDIMPGGTTSADDGQRRTYRLAVTVNGEYSVACLDGTEPDDAAKKAKVLSVLTINLNRANGIYDRDFGIRMNYVSGMDALIYLVAASDPFATSTSGWNTACRTTLTAFGSSNFDIGHLIGKVSAANENGNAGCIGCVCQNGTTNGTFKGSGFTAHATVQGDPLVVDYWTHEMGHQFGSYHTFTFSDEGSGANMEPGSGSTIMGYAGITGSTDVQAHSDDYFHAKSIDLITTLGKSGTPSTCPVLTNTGNTTPVANAGADYIIPMSTPFMLTGSGSDANAGDVLSYCWEQYDDFDAGSNTFPTSTSTTGPLFRSRTYSASTSRTFPILSSILSGANGNTWEALPSVGRVMNFRLTVRDNAVTGGANQFDDMKVTADASSGPFQVTAPNSVVSWKVGEFQTITWDVAGSNTGAVNCANVAIELSTDGGLTFPVTLAASTPNDGSQEVIVPNNISSTARVRIRGLGNIFFDISNADFSIQAPSAAEFAFSNPDAITACAGSSLSTTLNTAAILGFSTTINLSATGNPGGSTVVFSNASVTPGSAVTVSLQGTVAAGTYNITVTGTAGAVIRTRVITFNVVSPSGVVALSSPTDAATNVVPNPTFTWSALAGATTYTLTLALNPTFTSIYTTISGITGTSQTVNSVALLPNTQYYWKVTTNTVCGVLSSASRTFTTSAASCGTKTSVDVPKTILSASPNTVTSNLAISGSGTITDVDVVGLVATHSYISDIKMTLRSPALTTITLFDEICNDEQDFNLNLDDAAPNFTFPCPPVAGVTVVPQQSLAAFNGQDCNGTWTLTVQDKYSQDGGSLTGWGLRICLASGSLPVNWLNFTAKRSSEKSVLVEWTTASELNNNYFEVQRSQNGVEFETLGKVAAGTAIGTQYYLYNDLKPFAGVNYYRLKQVDKDGKFTYSSIVKVTMPNERSIYAINPNPAVNKTTLTAFTEMKKVNVRMMDASGKTVYSVFKPLIKPGETMSIPVTGLAKGLYMVLIDAENGRFSEKLIVQ